MNHQVFHADSLESPDDIHGIGFVLIDIDLGRLLMGRLDGFMEIVNFVDAPQRGKHLFSPDQNRNLDLTRGDHLNIDPGICQCSEHSIGHAGLLRHAKPDGRDLRDFAIKGDTPLSQCFERFLNRFSRHLQFILGYGE